MNDTGGKRKVVSEHAENCFSVVRETPSNWKARFWIDGSLIIAPGSWIEPYFMGHARRDRVFTTKKEPPTKFEIMKKVADGIYRKGDELYAVLEVDFFLGNWASKTKRLVSEGAQQNI